MPSNSKKRAIVYITDAGFLMPSLFSGSQIAAKTNALGVADIFVILVGMRASNALEASFSGSGIRFLELEQGAFWRKRDTFFNKTHVPITSLGRLAMQTVLPHTYEHVLYLDGDTYIAGNIEPLINHTVAPGKIAAANDCSWLSKGQLGSFWRNHSSYCHGLGLSDPTSYFNAGVLAFRMDTWRDMAPRALSFFEEHPRLCRYHDQSALNALFRDHRETLSPIWNFQSDYRELGSDSSLHPRVFHFTGGHKPWRTRSSVWGESIFNEYEDFMKRHPVLTEIHAPSKGDATRQVHGYRERLDVRNVVRAFRRIRKRAALRRYVAGTRFAV